MQRTILIIDDNAINRHILRKILMKEYAVCEAEDGYTALEILRGSYETVSAVLLDLIMPGMDGYAVLKCMQADRDLSAIPVIVTTGSTDVEAEVKALSLGANDFVHKPYNPEVILHRLWNTIHLRETAAIVNSTTRDSLTGLLNRTAFFDRVETLVQKQRPGHYVMACFDVENFKVVNDRYGVEEGDRVLRHIADVFKSAFPPIGGVCCRITADTYAVLYPASFIDTPAHNKLLRDVCEVGGGIPPIAFRIGRYVVFDKELSPSAMYDRASMAASSIKGRFDTDIVTYDETMRERMLEEQEIVSQMREALSDGQFQVWYQPQYNHLTGALIGAEALVRWQHPVRGMLAPSVFIPIFERNGFIYELDKFVWESCCAFQQRRLLDGQTPLPISVNVSRYDLLREDFLRYLIGLITNYGLSTEMLRLEITESAFAQSADALIEIVEALVAHGFTIEIDDFGSGYSSLNILKDVPANVLKLDMRFLESGKDHSRGGNILESIVRMAKWLGLSVIAEGVETIQQADYLKSIGCNYVQGYLYAKPIPEEAYAAQLADTDGAERLLALETVETLDNNAFWNPKSLDTLIFNSFVGGACIFEFHQDKTELLRVNQKFAEVLGGDTARDILSLYIEDYMDDEAKADLHRNICRAVDTGLESSCETLMTDLPGRPGATYIRSTVRVIARAGDRMLLYAAIQDVTAQRVAEQRLLAADEQLLFLNDVSMEFLSEEHADEGVSRVLRKTLEYYGASRAFIYQYHDGEDLCLNSYEVCGDNVIPADETQKRFPMDTVWYWMKTFQTSTIFQVHSLNELGKDRAEERKLYRGLHVTGVLAVSLRTNGRVTGSIGVYNPTKHLTGSGNLDAIGTFVAAIQERRTRAAALSGGEDVAAERIKYAGFTQDRRTLLTALDTAYPLSVGIDLTSGQYRTFSGAGYLSYLTNPREGAIIDLITGTSRVMLPEYADAYIRTFSPDALAATFAQGKKVVRMEYQQVFPSGKVHWLEVVALHVEDSAGDGNTGILLSRSIDEQKDTELSLQQALAVTNEELTTERKYQQAISASSPDSTIILKPADGTLLYLAGTLITDIGYTREEYAALQANHLKGFVYEEDFNGAFGNVASFDMEKTPTFEQEYRAYKKDGSLFWLHECGTLITLENGDPAYVIVCTDVTRRRELEDQLRASEEEVRMAMSQMGKMICLYDPVIRVLTLPEACAKLFGTPSVIPDMPNAERMGTLLTPEATEACEAFFACILRGDKTGSVEVHVKFADGAWHWARAEFSSVFDSSGKPVKVVLSVEDTTEQRQKDDETAAIRKNERVLQMVAAHSNRLVYRYDILSKTAYGDASYRGNLAASPVDEQLPEGSVARGKILPESVAEYLALFQDMKAGVPDGNAKIHMLHQDGRPFWADMRYSILDTADDGTPLTAAISYADVTEDHEKAIAYERYQQSIAKDALADGVIFFETDLTADIVEKQGGSVPFIQFPKNGCTHREAVSCGIGRMVPESEREQAYSFFDRERLLRCHDAGTLDVSQDFPVLLPDGSQRWYQGNVQMIQDPYSGHIRAHTILRDVTAEKIAALTVRKQAETDGMTGLYNRTTAEKLIRQRLGKGGDSPCILLIADLDNLKGLNDTLGHDQGDRAIRLMAEALHTQFRRTDIVGRAGGDEFLVFLDGTDNKRMLTSSVAAFMKKLSETPIGENNDVPLYSSVGAVIGTSQDAYETLFKRADKALYRAKRNGKNQLAIYTEAME